MAEEAASVPIKFSGENDAQVDYESGYRIIMSASSNRILDQVNSPQFNKDSAIKMQTSEQDALSAAYRKTGITEPRTKTQSYCEAGLDLI